MKRITVTLDTKPEKIATVGFVPFEGCPLAVTRPVLSIADREFDQTRWTITHIRMGQTLGRLTFKRRDEAFAFIDRAQPLDPCWQTASAERETREQCYKLFKAAVASGARP